MTPIDAQMTVGREDPCGYEVMQLLRESDRYYAALYPSESNHLLDAAALAAPNFEFYAARIGDTIAGFGAIVLLHGYAELKRMYVAPQARGRGIGKALLRTLEAVAAARGYAVVKLETGMKQPEAIALYRAAGYETTVPFGTYESGPLSLFMQKALAP